MDTVPAMLIFPPVFRIRQLGLQAMASSCCLFCAAAWRYRVYLGMGASWVQGYGIL